MPRVFNGFRLLALAATLLPGLAAADMPVIYKDGNQPLFRFSAPDFWTVRTGGRRDLTAPEHETGRGVSRVIGLQPSADPHVWMGFVAPQGVSTFAQAADYLRDIGPFLVKTPDVAGMKSARIGGLPAKTLTGTGSRNGRKVSFTAAVIDLPGPRMAVSVVVFEDGANPELVRDVNSVFASFRAQ